MSQFDYKLLQALATVVKEQSFEAAASKLFITQSAVSQRVKQLEQQLSQPVLIRSQPLKATAAGQKLIAHYNQVMQFQAELLPELFTEQTQQPITVHFATNADCLATWLLPAIQPVIKQTQTELNLLVSDENYTLQKVKNGEAFGAISIQQAPIKGCDSVYLGTMEYILVGSQDFQQHYFPEGISAANLKQAPAVAFDQQDNMHVQFIAEHFGLNEGDYPIHAVRSSEAFVAMAKLGLAHCLVPELQVREELKQGLLVNLLPDISLSVPLYWHHWQLLTGVHKALSEQIIQQGKQQLI